MLFAQLIINILVFFFSVCSIVLNRSSLIMTLMGIELMLLSVNLNFTFFSLYLDDMYGQVFSLFILTVVAGDSGVGLAIIILYYRLRGHINLNSISLLRY